MSDGWDINWFVDSNSTRILTAPQFQKYSVLTFSAMNPADVKADLAACRGDRESAPVAAYLSYLVRVLQLSA